VSRHGVTNIHRFTYSQRTLQVFMSVVAALFAFLPGSGLCFCQAWECSKLGGTEEFHGMSSCS